MLNIIGIDIGGTFTDFVLYLQQSGKIEFWKEPTTPADPIEAVIAGLKRVQNLSLADKVRLGTTIATNALLTRRGAAVAYVTTRGFRDIPFIQRGDRRSHYDISWIKAKPFVERRYCYEINERLSARGEVIVPLNEAEVRELARTIKQESIEAVAVCLLFSYLNPQNERRVRDLISEEIPGIPISISYDVLPKWKEYERASTTIADAFLKPVIARHFDRMRERFKAARLGNRIGIIKSNGGEATLANAAATPVQLALSGPTGAVVATRALAKLTGIGNLVTFDMGGTSTDCSTVVDGQEHITTAFEIEWGIPIQIPMIDIHSIGAGGGSIAWMDKGGMLRVGPQSAGASPGPACYGNGGTDATVTDANVVLGRISPKYFLGGKMNLDAAAARKAVEGMSKQLGKSLEETALSIVRIANANMVGALRSVLIERGLDPRDFTLMPFGGAGPLHVCDLIEEMGIPRAVVPNHPGQFSAYGFILTDARVDRHRTLQLSSSRVDRDRATEALQTLVKETVEELKAQGYAKNIQVYRTLEMRYFGQNYEQELPIAFEAFTPETPAALWEQFHKAHLARFDFEIPGETIEIVNFSVTAVSVSDKPLFKEIPAGKTAAAPIEKRRVMFGGRPVDTPICRRDQLVNGQKITGPALIEEAASVTVLNPGYDLTVDRYGNLVIGRAG